MYKNKYLQLKNELSGGASSSSSAGGGGAGEKNTGAQEMIVNEMIVRQIHELCFSRIPFESMVHAQGDRTLGKYLHDLINDKRHKFLLMGGSGGGNNGNKVNMMIINDNGTVEFEEYGPMDKTISQYSACYIQGQVLSVSGINDNHDNNNTFSSYDVLSQEAVTLELELPIINLLKFTMVEFNGKEFNGKEFNGKVFVIGGYYQDGLSNRVFYLDKNERQADTWIEQDATLITPRYGAAAATYQGKLWLAGGYVGFHQPLSSIEVFNPLVGSWQPAGNLTKERDGKIALLVINDDLFAVGTYDHVGKAMWVEKRDPETGLWQPLSEFDDGAHYRTGCAFVACGSTIYFIGGSSGLSLPTWNSFNTQTNKWASENLGEEKRKLPRYFAEGQAVPITPNEHLAVLAEYAVKLDHVEP
jgi:hypothetical protein